MRANGRASGPVLTSGFLVDLAHSAFLLSSLLSSVPLRHFFLFSVVKRTQISRRIIRKPQPTKAYNYRRRLNRLLRRRRHRRRLHCLLRSYLAVWPWRGVVVAWFWRGCGRGRGVVVTWLWS